MFAKLIFRSGLYWNTIRYLKPVQVYGRLWFRIARPKPDISSAPNLCKPSGIWVPCAARRQSLFAGNNFIFLNQHGSLEKFGWDHPEIEKLWKYNLHYFDDLNAEDAYKRTDWHLALLNNWVEHNLPGQGTGWEPYPTSLRIVNWIKWIVAGHTLPQVCVQSLAVQVRWLTKRLERHLLGNHYFSNAKALVFAGLAFEGKEAKKWLQKGLRIIEQELSEQVLSDGGNFERSPMYHSIFLEDVLDLINATKAWPDKVDQQITERWRSVANGMVGWLRGMTHPDGQIALFNDAAFGVTPTPERLVNYASRLCTGISDGNSDQNQLVRIQSWLESGYIRLETQNVVAFLDVAPIGPDYLPSHANADTLSSELSIFGKRIIINGGTSCYGNGPARLKERSTSSHSTVEIDGCSSSEVWGGFRVARRARPYDLYISKQKNKIIVGCSHDGYKRLSGKPIHRRVWTLQENFLEITDSIDGKYSQAVCRYIFHPDIVINFMNDNSYLIKVSNCQSIRIDISCGMTALIDQDVSFEFGIKKKTKALNIYPQNNKIKIKFLWSR